MSSMPWIFIVGAPRSGTSLLRRLLSSHPNLYISPELRVRELLMLAGALATQGVRRGQITLGPAGLQLGKMYVERIAHHQRAAHSSRRIGDKYPPYSLAIPQLDHLFPQAQFIHIIRDGRDVVSSLARTRATNRGWRREPTIPPTASLVRDWLGFVSAARKAGHSLGPARYHELRYEQLLSDPAPVLRRALAFLGEAPSAAVLQGAAEIRAGRSWRETLSPADWLAFHHTPAAESLLAVLGYPPTPHPDDRALERAAGQASATPTLSAPLASGQDDPALWAAAADEAETPAAQRQMDLRAIRGPHPDRRSCLRLLAQPNAPESVFAAMNAISIENDADIQDALRGWAEGRGLDPAASAALFPARSPSTGDAR